MAVANYRKHWPQVVLGALLTIFLVCYAAGWLNFRPLHQLNLWLYDARLAATMPNTVDSRLVIVDIDEKSLAAVGRWPWRRDKLATLMDQLFDRYKVAVVGFDIVFAEKDDSSGLGVLKELGQGRLKEDAGFQSVLPELEQRLDYDKLFAHKLENRLTVLGYFFNNDATVSKAGQLPKPVLPSGTFDRRAVGFITATGYGSNLPILMNSAASAGHFVPFVDTDGVTRRVAMLMEMDGQYYESLSLAMVRAYLNFPPVQPVQPGAVMGQQFTNVENLKVGHLEIPVDRYMRTLVPYRGVGGSYLYVSAVDVLEGKIDPKSMAGKIVLIGTRAAGLNDLRVAPIDAVYPGVEVHANLIAGMLDKAIPEAPEYLMGAEVLQILVLGALMIILLIRLSPLYATVATAVLLLLAVVSNFMLWKNANLAFPLAATLTLIVGLYALNMAYGYFFEVRNKRQLANLFGQYVVPELVEKMSDDPEKYTMEGQSRELTVLFSDVRSFTTISESMDPKELSRFMNEFLTTLSEVIRSQYLGTIDKYMGDCVMAFWGAPFYDPDHARNAVLAGLEMQRAIRALGPKLREKGWPEIHIGVGVNSGRMTVGDMGSQIRKAYTVMGDAVNLASRLEGLTKYYGVGMIVGEGTRNATASEIVYRELDRVRVKGKADAVAIYEPLGRKLEIDSEKLKELELYHRALKLYRQQDWDMAEMQLVNLRGTHPQDLLYAALLERIAHFRKNPPPADWDGVFDFETK